MEESPLRDQLLRIEAEEDLAIRALLLAALVSECFRKIGCQPVIVGGSAIEFYTEGAYMSGDIDICWIGIRKPTPVERADVMARQLGAEGGSRSWKVAGLFVDLLGELESRSNTGFAKLETPAGEVLLTPLEELLTERVFAARAWTGPNLQNEVCAKILMTTVLSGKLKANWNEIERVAALPDYDCLAEVRNMRQEVMQRITSS